MLDYRGFGKSTGAISSIGQLFEDNQDAYDFLKTMYNEDEIYLFGYSLGSGLAAKLASENNPARVVLKAPYYSMVYQKNLNYSWLPDLLLNYNIETHNYISKIKGKVVVFHGKKDRIIPIENSHLLKEKYPEKLMLIELENQGHNGINENKIYKEFLLNQLW